MRLSLNQYIRFWLVVQKQVAENLDLYNVQILNLLVLLYKGKSSAYDKRKVWDRLSMTKTSNRSTPYAVTGRKNSGERHSIIYQMNVWHL